MGIRLYSAALAVILALLATACAGGEAQPTDAPSAQQAARAQPPARPDRTPLVKGPVSPDGLRASLGTGDLGVGTNRVAFVLTSPTGFVAEPQVRVTSSFFETPGSAGEVVETASAGFQQWPYGIRGSYATRLNFDRAGSWGIDIAVETGAGSGQAAQLFFVVETAPFAVAVGSSAVASRNRTATEVSDLSQLTTGSLQDPDLYQTTIADAIVNGLPTVLVFASPAFCTNEVCGPQVEVLQRLKDEHLGKANFIHVDFYDNPHEIQGDLDKARISPVVREWGLPSIEWTYVIGRDGVVVARFEGFATFEEVEAAFLQAL